MAKVRDIEIGRLFGKSERVHIYLGTKAQEPVILKVAATIDDNDVITDESSFFNVLDNKITEIDELQSRIGEKLAHYGWLFTKPIDLFMEETQGNRYISVYAIPEIKPEDITSMTKLCNNVEIDVRTSVWIIGRLLKIYGFFELMSLEDSNVTKYPQFSADSYLIDPKHHRVLFYNCPSKVYEDVTASDYIKAISNFMLGWVCANDDPDEQEYVELLKDFAEKGRGKASEAHTELYDLVKEKWGIQYYPFTYRDHGAALWIKIEE